MQTDTLRLDVNRQVRDKTKNFYQLHTNFQTEEVTLEELPSIIRAGNAYTAPFSKVADEKHATCHFKANVEEVALLWIDDDQHGLDFWKADKFVSRYGGILHTTASSTPEEPRSRVLFVLDQALEVKEAELALKALFDRFPHVDQSVHDASRTLYGAKNCELVTLGHVLPLETLRTQIIKPYVAKVDSEKRARQKKSLEAQRHQKVDAPADQVTRYVNAAIHHVISDLTKATEGTGQRHELLRNGSVRLFSLQKAAWLTPAARKLTSDLEEQLLNAARANGYAAKYGEEDTLRIIQSGAEKATPAHEPQWRGYTNHTEVEPKKSEKTSVEITKNQVPAFEETKAKPFTQHTCKSGQKRGAAINIYLDHTTIKPFSDHDWRNCPACCEDYAYRKARQVESEAKKHELTLSWFDSGKDWTKTRKKWNQWNKRGKGQVHFTPFHQEGGRVAVIHSSTDESDTGQQLPKDEDGLEEMILELCQKPGDTRNRASPGFGGQWKGTRGEARVEEKEETDKKPACYQLKTNATTAHLAKRALETELDARGRGRKDLHCADIYLNLLDWQLNEWIEKANFKLEERHEHNNNNEVVRAIFDDDRVQEAIKYNQAYKKANAEVSPLLSTKEKLVVDINGDSQEVDATQQTLFFDSSEVTNLVEEFPHPVTEPLQEDYLDEYLEIMRG